jgi:hypothetical protein
LLQDAQKLPFRTEDSIAGSPSVPVRRGNPLTYAAAFNYERVEAARRDWEFAAHKIADLRDLCTALGMIPSESNAIPVLDLPEPNAESHASLALAGDRLALLQERYPRAVSGAADWSPSAFPDPIRQELAKRLRLTADTGMRHVRRLILKELNLAPGRPDTPTDWQRLPGGLLKKPEMAQWGKLLRLFFRWVDLPQLDVDPVADLTEFLQKPRIEAEIDSLELVIPNALRVERLAPDGPLVLAYLTSEGVPTSQEFKLDGPGLAVDQGVKYRFAPKSRPAKFRLRPGDDFSVGLALKSETGGFKLSWPTARTASYPIERLSREPWIVRTGPAGVPQRATGVQLRIVPEQPALRVPELLPEIPGLSK